MIKGRQKKTWYRIPRNLSSHFGVTVCRRVDIDEWVERIRPHIPVSGPRIFGEACVMVPTETMTSFTCHREASRAASIER